MAGYIGREPFSAASQIRAVFTATAGQTTFTFDYDVGFLDVYVNGLKVRPTEDYVALNETSVVFNTGLAVGTEVDLISFSTFEVANALSPTGDGSQLTGIDALPTQTGQTGKYLGTDGSAATWNTLDTDANSTTKGLYEHANTISANYSITSGNNAMTAGPITINTGVSVSIPSGSTWVIA